MRIKLALISILCACLIGSCAAVEEVSRTGCDADETLCPSSTRTATDVVCDCSCVAGWSGLTRTRKFTGAVAMCLPSTLNATIASPEELDALSKMSDAEYNQAVYGFCSQTVASYVDELITEQQRQRNSNLHGVCVGPHIRCSCTTRGATEQTRSCSKPCQDVECASDNCLSLLRRDNSIDSSACACSRVNACGRSIPRAEEAPMCTKRVSLVPDD